MPEAKPTASVYSMVYAMCVIYNLYHISLLLLLSVGYIHTAPKAKSLGAATI